MKLIARLGCARGGNVQGTVLHDIRSCQPFLLRTLLTSIRDTVPWSLRRNNLPLTLKAMDRTLSNQNSDQGGFQSTHIFERVSCLWEDADRDDVADGGEGGLPTRTGCCTALGRPRLRWFLHVRAIAFKYLHGRSKRSGYRRACRVCGRSTQGYEKRTDADCETITW
jgi:hypothetical protein